MINHFKQYEWCFFTMMGKYFADRNIIKEMDNQLYSNENMTWLVKYESITDVIGFCSIENKGKYYYFDNFYIIPKYRGKGYGAEILHKMLLNIDKSVKLITRNEIAKNMYLKEGFKIMGKNGRFYKMTKFIEKRCNNETI